MTLQEMHQRLQYEVQQLKEFNLNGTFRQSHLKFRGFAEGVKVDSDFMGGWLATALNAEEEISHYEKVYLTGNG